MPLPSVAIVLVNWNGYDDTKKCLESLKLVSYSNFKVILVDNASNDGSGERLAGAFPEVVYIQNSENLGFTGGNNAGIEAALQEKFDYIMLLNNDTTVEPDFLRVLVDTIDNNRNVGAIQPKILYMASRDIIWNAGGIFRKVVGETKTIGANDKDTGQYDQPKEIDWITGCCFMVKTSIVKSIGALNPKFFIYYEDVDWSLRIRELGYVLNYEPQSVIYHEAGMSNKKKIKGREGFVNPIVHYLNSRNSIWFLKRYTPWYFFFTVFAFQFIKFAAYLSYFVLRGRFIKARYFIRGIKEGLIKSAY